MAFYRTFLPLAALVYSAPSSATRPTRQTAVDAEALGRLFDAEGSGSMVALSLLQQGHRASATSTHWSLSFVDGGRVSNASTCTPLKNHGTHFTAEIEVGTPGQKFDVVADTGSDNVIVASCICKEAGRCREKDKCFRGTNRSSSFKMPSSVRGHTPALVLTFGSGQIEAVVATDQVQVGKVKTMMDDAVLLMVDQALSIRGPFEGILGLGLPRTAEQDKELQKLPSSPFTHSGRAQSLVHGHRPKGFLEHTGIRRFSMCFNDNEDGVLRLGTPAEEGALGSIGQFHWGLDFRGISVGSETAEVAFCKPGSKNAGQDTPCGAIPDSGTTVIMADPSHLKSLFEQLCDQWPRCQKEVAKKSSDYQKYELFQVLLMQCEDWMDNTTGLNELPPIHFHLVGSHGNRRTLKLDGNGYVFSTREDEVHYVTKHLFGVFPVKVAVPTGKQRNVCIPAFAAHKYTTVRNGPVWILGTPLFYEFQVGYDMQATPPAITFVDRPCGSCSGPSFIASDARRVGAGHASTGRSAHRLPREVHGPVRTPSFDLELPL